MSKVLVVADTYGWAFDKIYQGLKKNCKSWEVDCLYLHHPKPINFIDYDLVYYLCDNYLPPLMDWISKGLSKDKVILGIRSEVDHPIYDRKDLLEQTCAYLAVGNLKLLNRFESLHSNVCLAEGGIDTDIFHYVSRDIDLNNIRVGWSGAIAHWGRDFRGLDLTEEACKQMGYKWIPALREDKWRTTEEMVSYYKSDIDIFVEMSLSAGRQNGLVEAGSMGIPVISYDCGIANELIKHGVNGYVLFDRDVNHIKSALKYTVDNYKELSVSIAVEVNESWSWVKQAEKFEKMFDNVKGKSNG